MGSDARDGAVVLRGALAAEPVEFESLSIPVTVSVGVAVWHQDMAAAASLFSAADEALYRAKELGRNRTELFTP